MWQPVYLKVFPFRLRPVSLWETCRLASKVSCEQSCASVLMQFLPGPCCSDKLSSAIIWATSERAYGARCNTTATYCTPVCVCVSHWMPGQCLSCLNILILSPAAVTFPCLHHDILILPPWRLSSFSSSLFLSSVHCLFVGYYRLFPALCLGQSTHGNTTLQYSTTIRAEHYIQLGTTDVIPHWGIINSVEGNWHNRSRRVRLRD